jgi:hypothetical protein
MPKTRTIIAAVAAAVAPVALAAVMVTGPAVTSIASGRAGPAAAPCLCALAPGISRHG